MFARRGYRLRNQTHRLGDGFIAYRRTPARKKFILDWDTFSMILTTIAQTYNLPIALIEMHSDKGGGHNYVRWLLLSGQFLNWDTNAGLECTTPAELPDWGRRTMTRDEVISYVLSLRFDDWEKARDQQLRLADIEQALFLADGRPRPHNALAWMVATVRFDRRAELAARHGFSSSRRRTTS